MFCLNLSFFNFGTGLNLHGVDGWAGWDNNPAATAFVTNVQSLSPKSTVKISGRSDLVQAFPEFETGVWSYSEWLYIPLNLFSTQL